MSFSSSPSKISPSRFSPSTNWTVPEVPQTVDANKIGVTTIRVTWTAPASDGGESIDNYKVYRATIAGGSYAIQHTTADGTTYLWDDTAASDGQDYFYKVTATNAVGEGSLSAYAGITYTNYNTSAVFQSEELEIFTAEAALKAENLEIAFEVAMALQKLSLLQTQTADTVFGVRPVLPVEITTALQLTGLTTTDITSILQQTFSKDVLSTSAFSKQLESAYNTDTYLFDVPDQLLNYFITAIVMRINQLDVSASSVFKYISQVDAIASIVLNLVAQVVYQPSTALQAAIPTDYLATLPLQAAISNDVITSSAFQYQNYQTLYSTDLALSDLKTLPYYHNISTAIQKQQLERIKQSVVIVLRLHIAYQIDAILQKTVPVNILTDISMQLTNIMNSFDTDMALSTQSTDTFDVDTLLKGFDFSTGYSGTSALSKKSSQNYIISTLLLDFLTQAYHTTMAIKSIDNTFNSIVSAIIIKIASISTLVDTVFKGGQYSPYMLTTLLKANDVLSTYSMDFAMSAQYSNSMAVSVVMTRYGIIHGSTLSFTARTTRREIKAEPDRRAFRTVVTRREWQVSISRRAIRTSVIKR